MTQQRQKSDILVALRSERETWQGLLSKVDTARLTEPGVEGEWSIKDVISHITFYERRQADRIEKALRGEAATPSPIEEKEIDERNQIIFEQNRALTIEQVLKDSHDTFERLVAATSALSEEALIAHRLGDRELEGPLWKQISGNSYEHYHEHIPPLREWLGLEPQG